jgi:pimeloyl-ACP methyl ester carboxylesterase
VPSVEIGDVEVAYDVHGDGDDAFVLVHGSTGGRGHWLQIAPVLAERYRVVVPEYAGGPESPAPPGPLEVDVLAAQVLGAADDAGVARFHLAGWSLGSVVSAVVAATAPERVRSLTLACGWARTDARMRFTFDLWQRLLRADPELFARYAMADGLTAGGFELFGEGIDVMVPMLVAGLAPGAEQHAELDARVDITDRLAAITAPTLVVGGLEDRWVDIAHSRHLASTITDARLEELACGHLVPTEKGPELTALLLEQAEGR